MTSLKLSDSFTRNRIINMSVLLLLSLDSGRTYNISSISKEVVP